MANNYEPKSKSIIDWLSERTNRDDERIRQLEISQISKIKIDPAICDPLYQFQNGYSQAGDPYELFTYSLFNIDWLKVDGTLSSGTNGTVAFTLLPPFWPRRNITLFGNVEVVGSVQIATMQIDYTNGEVTVNY